MSVDMKVSELVATLKAAEKAYYNGNPTMTDAEYDKLRERLVIVDPENSHLKKVRSSTKRAETFPYGLKLGSMDKVKDEKALISWTRKYTGPYRISDKLDGQSGLLIYHLDGRIQLFTSAELTSGTDVSHLLKFFSLPESKTALRAWSKCGQTGPLCIRGELILSRKNWTKLSQKYPDMKNPRNVLVGSVLSSTLNSKRQDVISSASYVTYEVISTGEKGMEFSHQLDFLSRLGFDVVWSEVSDVSYETCEEKLISRRENSPYEIDGIIINDTSKCWNRTTDFKSDGNPRYAIAFKLNFESRETKVVEVNWQTSRYGYLTPVVVTETVKIGGFSLSSFSGHNARFIVDNNIGPGAIIEVEHAGSVIPHIVKTVTPAKKPSLPDGEWDWESVEIRLKTESDEQVMKRLEHFFTEIGVYGLKDATVKKLYQAGFTTVRKICRASVDDLTTAEGIKIKSATNLHESIQESLKKCTPLKVLVGSSCFKGLGSSRLEQIMKAVPDMYARWCDGEEEIDRDLILSLDGFAEKTVDTFVSNVNHFRTFLKQLPNSIRKQLREYTYEVPKGGQSFVFSGFRDKTLEQALQAKGHEVKTSVSKKVNFLVVKSLEETSTKITKARELGITIIARDQVNDYI